MSTTTLLELQESFCTTIDKNLKKQYEFEISVLNFHFNSLQFNSMTSVNTGCRYYLHRMMDIQIFLWKNGVQKVSASIGGSVIRSENGYPHWISMNKNRLQLSLLVSVHKNENKPIIINLKWIVILLFFEATKSFFHPL